MVEKQKQILNNIGYISLVDFLTQNNIDVKDIRTVFDETTKNDESVDIVGNFLGDQNIIDIFNNPEQEVIDGEISLEQYGYENYNELATKIRQYQAKHPDKNLADPKVQRSFIEGYHQSHKELDILANKQHAGDRITATVSELVQNAIDATAQAKDPSITPIGKFGMGAKTMFGSMGVGDSLLLQSKDKTFFVIKTGEGVESLICSDKIEFITAQLAKRGATIPLQDDNIGTVATLSYAKPKIDESIEQGINKFRYNPNVNIELVRNGENQDMNYLEDSEIKTEGQVRIRTQDYHDHKTISIEDEGNGFDPINLFKTSTKNSESRYSKEFNYDSKAYVNAKELNDVIMLIQGTEVSIDTIKNKERYIESTLIKGIVIENSSYLQTSESRSDWSVTDYTNQSLEHAFNNLIEDAASKQSQAHLINTLYLWYESLPQAKKLSLTPIKDVLIAKAQEVKTDTEAQFLPNLREFNQFDDGQTIFLHPDLIGTYSPENIPNANFIESKNGFAMWGVDMKVNKEEDIKLYEAIGNGETMQSQSQSKVLKLDQSIPPQIWIDNQLITDLDKLYEAQTSPETISQYNYKVWLLNANLNEINNSYKAVGQEYNYFDDYETKKYKEEKQKALDAKIAGDADIQSLNQEYDIKDKSFLLNVSNVLDGNVRSEVKKENTFVNKYSIKENSTGQYELTLGNEIRLVIDWSNNSYTIRQLRGEGIAFGEADILSMSTVEGGEFYDQFMALKKGTIELTDDAIYSITHDVLDGKGKVAFYKLLDIIDEISTTENNKPDLLDLKLSKTSQNVLRYHLDNDQSLNITPMENNTVMVRYSENGQSQKINIPLHALDYKDLFEKELLSTKISKNILGSFEDGMTRSKFESYATHLIEETIKNSVANVDNDNYEAKFNDRTIKFKNIEGCILHLALNENNQLLLSIESKDNPELPLVDLNLGNIVKSDDDLDPRNSFYRFMGKSNMVNVNQDTLELIQNLKIQIDAATHKYQLDDLIINNSEMLSVFENQFGEVLENNYQYEVDIRDDNKNDFYAILNNPNNAIRIDYSKNQKNLKVDFNFYDNNQKRKAYIYQTQFDGNFDLDKKISIENMSFFIHQAMVSSDSNEGEKAVDRITQEIIKQYAQVNETGVKAEDKKELLTEFAQVISELESIKSTINTNFDVNGISATFVREIKNLDQAKEWLANNQELVGYITNNQNQDEITSDLIARINRLKQNNYYVENLDASLDKSNSLSGHNSILLNTDNMDSKSKSSVLLSILSGEKTEAIDAGKFKNIMSNLITIEQGLGQSSTAAIDSAKSRLMYNFSEDKQKQITRIETITNNIVRIKAEKPELYEYIITKLTIPTDKDLPLLNHFFYNIDFVLAKDKALLRFMTTENAVLLENNKMDQIVTEPNMTVKPNNFTLGELGFMGRSVIHADQLTKDSIPAIQSNPKAQELSTKINKEINRLATSQVSGDKWGTVLRELFQNSKDSSNKMEGVSNINFNQDLYMPDRNSWLDPNQEYLRTEFSDDATGIPEFLFNYFNPMKSTKDIEDAVSAGAFGCGAITINSIADYYEIVTKNKDEKEGFSIKVEVIKSKDGTQVIGTKVIELSRINQEQSGTNIRMYSKNTEQSTIPELQALISQGSLVELSELEVLNNPKINLSIQGEQRQSPEKAKSVYQSDKVQFVEGVKSGYWVKNLFVSDINHDQNQFTRRLPEFLSTMLKDNPVAVNFQNKLELVRTRTGFSEAGEKEAVNILTQEYLKYIATSMYNGSQVKIPGLDADLSSAYRKYTTGYTNQLSDELYNGAGLSLEQLGKLQNSNWIAMLLNAPIEVEGQNTSLKELFGIMEDVVNQAQKEDISSQSKIEESVKGIVSKMDTKTQALYNQLQKSKLANTYGAVNIRSAINLSLSTEKIEKTEKLLDPKDLPESSLKTRQLFEKVFSQLTANLPISRYSQDNTDHRMVYVTREVGNDHSGQIKTDDGKQYMLWKFDYKKIGLMGTKSTLSANDYSAMFEVVVHEIAHQLEQVGHRKPGTHDEIFDELMRCNFARLLNE